MITEFGRSAIGFSDVLAFLEKVDNAFEPPFSQRVTVFSTVGSVEEYLRKVSSHGHIIICHTDAGIEGLVMLYANDMIHRTAYIPFLAVAPEYSGRGIATELVREAVRLAAEKGMKTITVKTWASNKTAKHLYLKAGFMVQKSDETGYVFEKPL